MRGSSPSQYLDNVREEADLQAQLATPYEETPPYTENPHPTPALSSTSAPPYTSGPASTTASPSYAASAASPLYPRLLHVYHSGITHRNYQILGPDKSTVLYTVTTNAGGLFGSRPHVTVCKANTSTIIGTATFHHFSRTVEMVIHHNPVALSPLNFFTSAHEWTSLATTTEGKRMRFKWKSDSIFNGGDMICLDQQGKVWAKFVYSMWALKKGGKFEMGPFVSGDLMDEIVVTGSAVLEARRRNKRRNKRRNNRSAAGASAVGFSAGAGSGC